jgi:hypothetical protein
VLYYVYQLIWSVMFTQLQYLQSLELARKAHEGQMNGKSGEVYFLHPLRVSKRFVELGMYFEASIAILHDTLEDTQIDQDAIKKISIDLYDSVYALTKQAGQKYSNYQNQVLANAGARIAKLEDVRDNFDLNRLTSSLTNWDVKRTVKYAQFALLLTDANYKQSSQNKYINQGMSVEELILLTNLDWVSGLLTEKDVIEMALIAEAIDYSFVYS